MGKKYLIDSNSLIEFQAKLLPIAGQLFVANAIDDSFNISIISEIEVLGHVSATPDLEKFISLANIFDLNKDIVTVTISLRKKYKIKLGDAIIAATALVNDFIIITRNINDFKNIEDLQTLNPFEV